MEGIGVGKGLGVRPSSKRRLIVPEHRSQWAMPFLAETSSDVPSSPRRSLSSPPRPPSYPAPFALPGLWQRSGPADQTIPRGPGLPDA